MTIHYELHILRTAHDVTAAAQAGLPDASLVSTCANCDTELNPPDYFKPRAIVINHEDDWIICMDCAQPIAFAKLRNPGL